MTASEGREKLGRIGSAPQGEGRELEPGDPTLRPLRKERHIRSREADAHHRLEKGRRLAVIKTEVGRAYLNQLSTSPQARKGKRWVSAGSQDEMHLRRQVVEQERHPPMNRLCLDDVIVIQYERNILCRAGKEFVGNQSKH